MLLILVINMWIYSKDGQKVSHKILKLIGLTCADSPCNGGTCYIIFNDQIKCECPVNRTGLLCEKDATQVTVTTMSKIINKI